MGVEYGLFLPSFIPLRGIRAENEKALRQSKRSWKFVFRLPAINEEGGRNSV
jgi:hypothetical protein